MKNLFKIFTFIVLIFNINVLLFSKSKDYFNTKILAKVEPDQMVSLKLDKDWYLDTTFYHIWIKAFNDSNGDGIGDIKGITQKLDYLSDLGIDGIWLSPFFDCYFKGDNMHGYDVIDHYKVNPKFGNIDDVKELLIEAHKRNIKVIFDFVPNHVSDWHPWFIESKNNPNSPKRKWFVWQKNPNQAYELAWGGGTWKNVWHKYGNEYYYGAFWRGMPDINFNNIDARTEITNVLIYWLNFGFDGARVDAVRYLVEDGPVLQADRPKTIEYFKELRKIIDKYTSNGYAKTTVAEAWTDVSNIARYYGNGTDAFHMCFDFPFAYAVKDMVPFPTSANIEKFNNTILENIRIFPKGYRNATFLSNHDEVAPRPGTQYLGDQAKIKLATTLLLLMPGTPFIYYANEIGQKDGNMAGDIRHRQMINWDEVVKQSAQKDSILNETKRLIDLRKRYISIRRGNFERIRQFSDYIYVVTRKYENEKVMIVINFENKNNDISLTNVGEIEKIYGENEVTKDGNKYVLKNVGPFKVNVFLVK